MRRPVDASTCLTSADSERARNGPAPADSRSPLTPANLCPAQTRLMAQQKAADGTQRYRGFLHALVTIPREEGLRAMWKGLLPRLMRIPPGQVRLQQLASPSSDAGSDLT